MDKEILRQYLDACELIRETEEDIRKLERRKRVVLDNVRRSNPEYPYEEQRIQIEGTEFTLSDDTRLRAKQEALQLRKDRAEALKAQVEVWMVQIPPRIQRIIKHRFFERRSWQETAHRMHESSGDNLRMELDRFLRKN